MVVMVVRHIPRWRGQGVDKWFNCCDGCDGYRLCPVSNSLKNTIFKYIKVYGITFTIAPYCKLSP
jgi:hypothetical protein